MKSVAVVTLACMLATASAFTAPTMATRAIGNPFKKAAAPAPAVSPFVFGEYRNRRKCVEKVKLLGAFKL